MLYDGSMCSSLRQEFLQKQLQSSRRYPSIPIYPHPGIRPCGLSSGVWSSCDPIVIYKTDRVIRTDQGNPFIATGKEKLLCPQLGPGNPTSCWMKPTDPIPPGTNPRPGQRHSENTDPGQDAVSQTPSTDSIDSALDTTFSSAFNPQSQPADYTTQEGTTGLSGILPAADKQNQAGYTSFQTASADVPETQATTSQPNELANNDFQMDDLSSLFPGTG